MSTRGRQFGFLTGVGIALCATSLTWAQATNIFPATGNAGIGTVTPSCPLEIMGPTSGTDLRMRLYNTVSPSTANWCTLDLSARTDTGYSTAGAVRADLIDTRQTYRTGRLLIGTPVSGSYADLLCVSGNGGGRIGVKTWDPGYPLDVVGEVRTQTPAGGSGGFVFPSPSGANTWKWLAVDGYAALWSSTLNLTALGIEDDGDVWIGGWNNPADLTVLGTTHTQVLQITGGSDLAEPFAVATSKDEGAKIEPGMVVVIDADHPGQLKLSSEAYDRKVAGIISGANGLSAGMVMTAANHPATRPAADAGDTSDHPVALTGRVWCWCDAAYGAITPGDRLTTSGTPGHAMKVTDRDRADGAVVGKAMSELKSGKGLVLVLVSMQ